VCVPPTCILENCYSEHRVLMLVHSRLSRYILACSAHPCGLVSIHPRPAKYVLDLYPVPILSIRSVQPPSCHVCFRLLSSPILSKRTKLLSNSHLVKLVVDCYPAPILLTRSRLLSNPYFVTYVIECCPPLSCVVPFSLVLAPLWPLLSLCFFHFLHSAFISVSTSCTRTESHL